MRNPFRRKKLPKWQYTLMNRKTHEIFYVTDTNNFPPQAEARILEYYASKGHDCSILGVEQVDA